MRQKLTLITLGTRDFKRSLSFYEGLGWKKSSASMEGMALFPLGGIVLGLHPHKALFEDTCIKGCEDDSNKSINTFSGITISYNAISKEEVDDVLSKVEKLGATIIKPAQNVYWGGYSGYFRDYDGHVIEVAYNPFWELDENCNIKLPV